MQHALTLHFDHHLLGAAVAELLLDLADLDGLVQAEGGTHAKLGFGVITHLVEPNAFTRCQRQPPPACCLLFLLSFPVV